MIDAKEIFLIRLIVSHKTVPRLFDEKLLSMISSYSTKHQYLRELIGCGVLFHTSNTRYLSISPIISKNENIFSP